MIRYSQQQITEEDIKAVDAVLRSDHLTQGPAVEAFEADLAEYVGAQYCVAVANGTLALQLAYMAERDWPILTSPLSFVATASAATMARRGVGFADVDPLTGNLDVTTVLVRSNHTVVPVHFAGRAARIPTGDKVSVIEDACHALGAMDYDGCSRVGSCAHSLASVFSFHPTKPITCGEGGAITTNDQGFADELRKLRNHGRVDGLMVSHGLNARMTDMQAALGRSQLTRCDAMRDRRCELAQEYCWRLDHAFGEEQIAGRLGCCNHNFTSHPDTRTSHHLYPVRIKQGRRDEVKAKLNAHGIGAQIHYSPVIPLHPFYRAYGYKPGGFPNAEAWAAEELSLPLHSGMRDSDVERVVNALREALE